MVKRAATRVSHATLRQMQKLPTALLFAVALPACAKDPSAGATNVAASATASSSGSTVPSTSAAPSASAISARIAGGHSSSGGHHISVQYDETNPRVVPSAGALDGIVAKISTCFRATPQYTASGAARIDLRVEVSAKGEVSPTATIAYGTLHDQGHGAQAYEFGDASSPKNDAFLTCALDAAKTATYPAGSNGTSFDAHLTFSP